MPHLRQIVTTTTTTVVKLAPALKRKLLTTVKTYAGLKGQRDTLDHAMKGHRKDVEELMEEAGESKLAIDGYKVSIIAPVRRTLDVKRLISLGVSADVIERAWVETPQAPYVKISAPGSKDDE